MPFSKLPEPKLPGVVAKRLGTLEGKLIAKARTLIDDVEQDLLDRAKSTARSTCPSSEEIKAIQDRIGKIRDLQNKATSITSRYDKIVRKSSTAIRTVSVSLPVLENIILPPLIPVPTGTINTATVILRDILSALRLIVSALEGPLSSTAGVISSIDGRLNKLQLPLQTCLLSNSLGLDEKIEEDNARALSNYEEALNAGEDVGPPPQPKKTISQLVEDLLKQDFDLVPKEFLLKEVLKAVNVPEDRYLDLKYNFSLDKNKLTKQQAFIIQNPSTNLEVFRLVTNDVKFVPKRVSETEIEVDDVDVSTSERGRPEIEQGRSPVDEEQQLEKIITSKDYNNFLIYSGSYDQESSTIYGAWYEVSVDFNQALSQGIISQIEDTIANIELSDEDRGKIDDLIDSLLDEQGLEDGSLPQIDYAGYRIVVERESISEFFDFTSDIDNLSDLDPNVQEQLSDVNVVAKLNRSIPRFRVSVYLYAPEVLAIPLEFGGKSLPILTGNWTYVNDFEILIQEGVKAVNVLKNNLLEVDDFINNFFNYDIYTLDILKSEVARRKALRDQLTEGLGNADVSDPLNFSDVGSGFGDDSQGEQGAGSAVEGGPSGGGGFGGNNEGSGNTNVGTTNPSTDTGSGNTNTGTSNTGTDGAGSSFGFG